MEEARINITPRNKSRVVLDKRFDFAKGLSVGDKGMLNAKLSVDSMRIETCADGLAEMLAARVKVVLAELMNKREMRA